MARHLHRLTATAIANLRAKGLHPDGGGLYMRLTANGSRGKVGARFLAQRAEVAALVR